MNNNSSLFSFNEKDLCEFAYNYLKCRFHKTLFITHDYDGKDFVINQNIYFYSINKNKDFKKLPYKYKFFDNVVVIDSSYFEMDMKSKIQKLHWICSKNMYLMYNDVSVNNNSSTHTDFSNYARIVFSFISNHKINLIDKSITKFNAN